MATKDELLAQRAKLVSQLSQAKTIRHGDKSVENRTVDEIRAALRVIENELGIVDPTGVPGKRNRQIRFYTSGGI